MALCALKPILIKPPSKHKTRTWKFAGEFLIRKQFQKDQVVWCMDERTDY